MGFDNIFIKVLDLVEFVLRRWLSSVSIFFSNILKRFVFLESLCNLMFRRVVFLVLRRIIGRVYLGIFALTFLGPFTKRTFRDVSDFCLQNLGLISDFQVSWERIVCWGVADMFARFHDFNNLILFLFIFGILVGLVLEEFGVDVIAVFFTNVI